MTLAAEPHPAVPSPLRRPVAILSAVGTLGLAVLAVRYAGRPGAGGLDGRIGSRLDGLENGTPLERVVPFADPVAVIVAAFLLAVICLAMGRYRLAVVAVAGPGLTGVVTTILKPVIGRTIDGEFALPSGHTGGATSLAAVAALLMIGIAGARVLTITAAVGGVVLVGALTGVALVAVGAHYTTDTLAGFCTAVAAVGGVALTVDMAASRLHRRGPSDR